MYVSHVAIQTFSVIGFFTLMTWLTILYNCLTTFDSVVVHGH